MTREQLKDRALRLYEQYVAALRLRRAANEGNRRLLDRVLSERALDAQAAVEDFKTWSPV